MARRGENIYKRKDNRWEGRYIKGYDYKGKAQFGYVYAKTYREVREKLTAAKQTSFNKPTPNIQLFLRRMAHSLPQPCERIHLREIS